METGLFRKKCSVVTVVRTKVVYNLTQEEKRINKIWRIRTCFGIREPEYDRLSQSIHRDENGIKAKKHLKG